jgi:phospholipid/cholesterol/gamma-HCH transport system substrate-binding protein
MLGMKVRLQLIAFLLVSVVGVAYVAVRYVGVGEAIFGGPYTISADFARSGGIFTNAAVTYRGVQVGRVGPLKLRPGGVRVALQIDEDVEVPKDVRAVVANRSAVGEQYVDLRPERDSGPYLRAGDVIPRSHTATPLAVEVLLSHMDRLLATVDTEDLRIVLDELGTAFNGTGVDLQRLLDGGDALLADAQDALPETVALLEDGRTVLDTQAASSAEIKRWARSLASLSDQIRRSDPDLRRLLVTGPLAATEVTRLVQGLTPTFGVLLGNLTTLGDIAVRRLPGIEQILVTYPAVIAGGYTVTPGDGTAHFGLVLNVDDPPPCKYSTAAPITCTDEQIAQGSSVRGERNAPRAGDSPPPPSGGAQTASGPKQTYGYDPKTGTVTGTDGRPVVLGGTGGQQQYLGGQSAKALLLSGLS